MEGLVLLLGELAALLLGPSIAALVLLVTSALELAGELVAWCLRSLRRRRPEAPAPAPEPSPAPPPESAAAPGPEPTGSAPRRSAPRLSLRWLRRAGWAAAGALVVALLVVCAIDLFFFAPLVRAIAGRVEARTGIAIAFDDASGSLWQGRATLTGASFRRTGHPTGDFDLGAAEVEVDLDMWRFVSLQARLESVTATGITGEFVRTGVADRLTSRRRFRLERLELARVDIRFRDDTRVRPVVARVELDSFSAAPFRSDRALFDVLFRSTLTGRIGGQSITVQSRAITVRSRAIDGGRETSWRGEALPLAVVSPYLPGPLKWIEEGTLDVEVTDRWDIEGPAEIAMDWKLDFEGVRVVLPEDWSLRRRLVAMPIVKWLNGKDRRLPLRFKLNIDRNRFDGSASPEAAGLVKVVGDAIARSLAAAAGVEVDTVRDVGRKAADRVKSFLDRRRKK